jgi:hypothetical protein
MKAVSVVCSWLKRCEKYLQLQMGKLVLTEIKTIEELQKRIAVFKRKAARKKNARNMAEK